MTEEQILYVKNCIADNNMHRFYIWKPWMYTRVSVLTMDRYECQDCKRQGIYTKATTVHHNQYVKHHPELALEIYYTWKDKQQRNLVSLCHECHEKRHGYRKPKEKKILTEERWD